MNRLEFQNLLGNDLRRRLIWPVLCCGFFAAFSGAAAPQPLYQNFSDSFYYTPFASGQNPPPQIDATAFDNESIFSINFNQPSVKIVLYQTSDTLFYTNGDNGVMIANSLAPTNLITGNFETYYSDGAGFTFACKTNTVKWSDTFYNSGTIRCDSVLDGNFIYGECNIMATNIYNPGNIELGMDSLLQFTGQKVDLSRSVLDIESLQDVVATLDGCGGLFDNINLTSTGAVGINTNIIWDPSLNLGVNFAYSSYPDDLYLTNSTPYIRTDGLGSSNVTYRAVFVQNNSGPNVTYKVYIQPSQTGCFQGNLGTAYLEWAGVYTDPASGTPITNYLYLNDDYALGASTNAQVTPGPGNYGYPNNFTFAAFSTPQLTGQTPPGFTAAFPAGGITNWYSYFNGTISPSTVNTNASASNPYGTITNIFGRIQVSAGSELNLNNAIISGQNYMSISATNQFDGSAGSFISSPYSDISLGVTNGNLGVTNLLVSNIPNWSGTIQAWSTRWTNTDAVTGINYDYRVLLVFSQLQPTTQPWVQNLRLHSSTNLVISDVLNVYGSLYTDAYGLTITTNGIGFGATSVEGQLNSIVQGNLGPAQFPNLQYVTNYGVLSGQNLILFTNQAPTNSFSSLLNYGVIADQGTMVCGTNFFNSGSISNGAGNLSLRVLTNTLAGGSIYATGNVTIAGNTLLASNSYLQCLSLTLNLTNYLFDSGVTNGNVWVVGRTNATGGSGFSLLTFPVTNHDLLGTTITNICPPANKQDANIWAAKDYGATTNGFHNNAALGRLILDVLGPTSLISISGTGTSNALYVDSLEFRDVLTNGINTSFDFSTYLSINTNITIYFAQAYVNGISIAEKIDNASLHSGKNGGSISNGVVTPGRLRWVPTYAGYFSSTNYVINGVTNSFNDALAVSPDIDSNDNGTPNLYDPAPFTISVAPQLTITVTNQPSRMAVLTWNTLPLATNTVYYATSLRPSTNIWLLYTNFLSTLAPGPAYSVTATDTNALHGIRFYKVLVQPPNLTY